MNNFVELRCSKILEEGVDWEYDDIAFWRYLCELGDGGSLDIKKVKRSCFIEAKLGIKLLLELFKRLHGLIMLEILKRNVARDKSMLKYSQTFVNNTNHSLFLFETAFYKLFQLVNINIFWFQTHRKARSLFRNWK